MRRGFASVLNAVACIRSFLGSSLSSNGAVLIRHRDSVSKHEAAFRLLVGDSQDGDA